MKQLLILISLFFLPEIVISQIMVRVGDQKAIKQLVIDTIAINVFYEFRSVKDPLKPEIPNKDMMVLEIGSSGISKFYSDNARRCDSLLTRMTEQKVNQFDFGKLMDDHHISPGGETNVIYKNYPSGKITYTDNITSSDYLYEELNESFQWQIVTDTMTILTYLCQKAVTDFRGRHYEAWFAVDIPINEGPWKFSGLPGLILKVSDQEEHFVFMATAIQKEEMPLVFADKNYIKTNRKELSKIYKKYSDDPIGYIKNSYPGASINIRMQDELGNEVPESQVKYPYNPIELN